MRIKFEKGMTPEKIAENFVKFVRENDILIGSVNIYIQTYDDEMKPEEFHFCKKGQEFFVCQPSDESKKEYIENVAEIRRKRLKAIS